MLVRPEQVVAVAMHGGSLMGNLRRAGKKGMSRKRLMALALALGASAAAAGGVQHHRRAGQRVDLQHQLDGLTRGYGHWDAIAAQVAAGDVGGSMTSQKLARNRQHRRMIKYGSLLSPFTAPLAWYGLRKWDERDLRLLREAGVHAAPT